MTASIRKAVLKQIEAGLKEVLPQFVRDRTQPIPPGWVLFSFRPGERLTLYLLFNPHRYHDQFTFDIGWSEQNCLPKCGMAQPTEAAGDGGILFRIVGLMETSSGDHWWNLGIEHSLENFLKSAPDDSEEIKHARVTGQVEDALRVIRSLVVPYFERIAAEHGYSVKLR